MEPGSASDGTELSLSAVKSPQVCGKAQHTTEPGVLSQKGQFLEDPTSPNHPRGLWGGMVVPGRGTAPNMVPAHLKHIQPGSHTDTAPKHIQSCVGCAVEKIQTAALASELHHLAQHRGQGLTQGCSRL